MTRLAYLLILTALANIQQVSTETKYSRTKPNFFSPVLSANVYYGHIKENERLVQVQPHLHASDADSSSTPNGKICGYELSLHKHDDLPTEVTENIPFAIELVNNEAILKLKLNINTLDCEITQTYRLFVRAYDCAENTKRRYSERSSLIITVDDINEHAPVFTHNQYLFKLHQGQTCEDASCRVEATDDDCANSDHRVCNYEIITPNVPFTIDSKGAISISQTLTKNQYEFDVVAIDCFPSNESRRLVSQPARVTVKILSQCRPMILDNASEKLLVQSDKIHLFDTIQMKTCDETCHVEDIVGKVELNSHGLESGCNAEQCSSTNREYHLLPKDETSSGMKPLKSTIFNGLGQAIVVNQTHFPGHFNNEFRIRMMMKHSQDEKMKSHEKEHIFCKSDHKLKNRHHAALFLHNGYLKLLLRKEPLGVNDKTRYPSEWMWKIDQINDNQWHTYELVVNYPTKVDLYIDDEPIISNLNNFRVVEEYSLRTIPGTDETLFTLGACWHARASRMVQHFHGELSGLTIEQKEELQRSSDCVRDCKQYLDLTDIQRTPGLEFTSNSNRSMWILRADNRDSYEQLLKHLVYRNQFQPTGPDGQRTVSIHTTLKCLGEPNTYDLPVVTRTIDIHQPKTPVKLELKSDTTFSVPEPVMDTGIYLFKNLFIFTNAISTQQVDIQDCTITAKPSLARTEQLILPDNLNQDKDLSENGAMISGVDSIDSYQHILRQVAYLSSSPAAYVDREFTLVCTGVTDQIYSNELRVQVRIQKQMPGPNPVAAMRSNQLYVDNDQIRANTFETEERKAQAKRNPSDWPIALVVFACVGLVSVLVLYLIVRVRSNNRQHLSSANNADDLHSQMEWEDDIGLNITVNPLDETKKSPQPVNAPNASNSIHEYRGSSSDEEDDDEYENNPHQHNHYSSEEDEGHTNGQTHAKKLDHQLEWDDAAIEYGPKRV